VEPLKTALARALASTITIVHASEPKVAAFGVAFADISLEAATNGPGSDQEARPARRDREMPPDAGVF
jgi:hypothetical protein